MSSCHMKSCILFIICPSHITVTLGTISYYSYSGDQTYKNFTCYKIPDLCEQPIIPITGHESILYPIADGVEIWEVLASPVEEQLANCLSGTSQSMCLVIQAFSLILYILRNSGSVNAMIFFFKAICLLRSIPASLECLNLLTKNKRKQNKSLMDIFPLNKSSMAFIALQRNCTKGLYSVKAQTSIVSRSDVCKLVLNLKSLAKN